MSVCEDRGLRRGAALSVAVLYALLMMGASFVDQHKPLSQHDATHCAVCASTHSPQAAAQPDVPVHLDAADAGVPLPLGHLSYQALLPASITGRSPPSSAIRPLSRRAA